MQPERARTEKSRGNDSELQLLSNIRKWMDEVVANTRRSRYEERLQYNQSIKLFIVAMNE